MAVRVATTAVATSGAIAVAFSDSAAVMVGVSSGVGVGEGVAVGGTSVGVGVAVAVAAVRVAVAVIGTSVKIAVAVIGFSVASIVACALVNSPVGDGLFISRVDVTIIVAEGAGGVASSVTIAVSAANADGTGERPAVPRYAPIKSPPNITPMIKADAITSRPIKIKAPDAERCLSVKI